MLEYTAAPEATKNWDISERRGARENMTGEEKAALIIIDVLSGAKRTIYPGFCARAIHCGGQYFIERKSKHVKPCGFIGYLKQNGISELEIAGIDGNGCAAHCELDASNSHFSVVFILKYIGIKDKERFANTKKKLEKAHVVIIER